MRKVACLFGLLLCLPAAAQEGPSADVFLGYSYIRVNPKTSGSPSFNLNGGTGSLTANVNSYFGIVAGLRV